MVIPGHDRVLEVTDDAIVALTDLHETIVIPPGVVNVDRPRHLDLVGNGIVCRKRRYDEEGCRKLAVGRSCRKR